MAVTMAPIANRLWQGTSGDTKPTDARVVINDIWYQTDTQAFYIWTGTTWALCAGTPVMRTY